MPTKIVVIPPWIDTNFIHPLPRHNTFSKEYDLDDYFVILYAGNLGFSQGLEKILLTAQQLHTQPNFQFVLIGDGPNRQNLVRQTTELGLTNVKFIPFQARERLPELLATADLALVTQQSGLGIYSLPSKTFPILASGRPVLAVADESSGLQKLVTQSGAGVCVPPAQPEKLAEAILNLSQEPENCHRMGQQGRDYALRYHARTTATRQFETVLKSIINH